MSQRPLPIPDNVYRKMLGFLLARHHGRIELDIRDGKIIQCRILETIRPDDEQERRVAA